MSSFNVPNTGAMNPSILRRLGALEVQEILDTVMLLLDKSRDLFAASLVCKTWTPVALDHLWRTLDSVVPLCMLLGPMEFQVDCWRYTDTILGADWTRFEFYSQKVRRINNRCGEEELGPGTLTQVVNIRPPSIPYILPRVAEISWGEPNSPGGILDLIPLLSPALKSFALEVRNQASITDALVVLRHLLFLPGLKLESFHAEWVLPLSRLKDAVCDILDRHSDSLKSFSRQPFELDERFLNSLTELVNLVKLRLTFQDFSVRTDEDFNNFSNVLASRCPGLKQIQFWLPPGRRESTFHAIRPLTRIKGLREIMVWWGDLDLEVEDFREMGNAWRSLVALRFPVSKIPLARLATIAEHFSPTLEEIKMKIQVPGDLNPDCNIPAPFTFLKRISFIRFAAPETFNAVGSFFCKLVASNTVVECFEEMEQPLRNVTGNSVNWEGRQW